MEMLQGSISVISARSDEKLHPYISVMATSLILTFNRKVSSSCLLQSLDSWIVIVVLIPHFWGTDVAAFFQSIYSSTYSRNDSFPGFSKLLIIHSVYTKYKNYIIFPVILQNLSLAGKLISP